MSEKTKKTQGVTIGRNFGGTSGPIGRKEKKGGEETRSNRGPFGKNEKKPKGRR